MPPIILVIFASYAPLSSLSQQEFWGYVIWMLILYFANWLTSVWIFGSNKPTSRLFAALPSISVVTAVGTLLIYGCIVAYWLGVIGYTANILANTAIGGAAIMISSIIIISSKSAETHGHQVTKTALINRLDAIESIACVNDIDSKKALNAVRSLILDVIPHPSNCDSRQLDELVNYLDKLKGELREDGRLQVVNIREIERLAKALAS